MLAVVSPVSLFPIDVIPIKRSDYGNVCIGLFLWQAREGEISHFLPLTGIYSE